MKDLLKESLQFLREIPNPTHGLTSLIRDIEDQVEPIKHTVTPEWLPRSEETPKSSTCFYRWTGGIKAMPDNGFFDEEGVLLSSGGHEVTNYSHYCVYDVNDMMPKI